MSGLWRLTFVHVTFGLSGIAGLGYQMVFVRTFSAGLGHELPATLAIVGAFFGGLALGAWALDRPIGRSRRPGHWYVGLEVVSGSWALVCVGLIGPVNGWALQAMGAAPSAGWQWAVSLGLPLLTLLPATMALGATLPAIERFVSPPGSDRRSIGGLYAVNTLGAVAGTLAGAFVLVPALGYRGSIMAMAGLDLLCAAMVAAMLLTTKRSANASASHPSVEPPASGAGDGPLRGRRLMLTLFATGLLGIGFEVVGLRVLAQVIENTVYSYAAALSVFLVGTAVGAAVYQALGGRTGFDRLLGWLLTGLASACMLGGVALAFSREIYQFCRLAWGNTLAAVAASEMVVAAAVFALPALLMGATFSHHAQASKRRDGGVGSAVAINTAGAALAPLVVGVLLVPWVGMKWTLVVVALGYLALLPDYAKVPRWSLLLPLGILLLLPADLRLVRTFEGQRVIGYREGVMASVAIIENEHAHRFLRVNNRFQMGGTSPASNRLEMRQGHVPLLLHAAPRRALFLGIGTGGTAMAAGDYPGLHADAVELVPEVVEVLPEFAVGGRHLLDVPNVDVFTADARRFVRASSTQYDVIVADLFHPARDGGGMLYTREHFAAVRDRLAPDGVFVQWLPMYQLDEPTLRVILRTFLEVFGEGRAVLHDVDLNFPALGLVATRGSWPAYRTNWLRQRATTPTLQRQLAELGLRRDADLFGLLVADGPALRAYAGQGPVNTDNRPVVVHEAPRFAAQRGVTSYGRLIAMLESIEPSTNPWGLTDSSLRQQVAKWLTQRDRAIDKAVRNLRQRKASGDDDN